MKKFAAVFVALSFAVGLMTGCGDTYEAVESTVFIQKDGTILSTDIESFDPGTYDESGLKSFVEEAISDYNADHGVESVKLNDLSFEDGKAKLSIEYASTIDYTKFNDIELFNGSIAEALAAGYNFDGEFAEFKDGKKTLCDASAFLNGDGYKVVIIKANTNVHVNGKVKYASVKNVSMIDSSTVAISNEAVQEEVVEDEPEETETVEPVVDEITEDPSAADEGSIDDDELLLDEEEEEEVVFVFDETERPQVERPASINSNYTNVYTYIIYK